MDEHHLTGVRPCVKLRAMKTFVSRRLAGVLAIGLVVTLADPGLAIAQRRKRRGAPAKEKVENGDLGDSEVSLFGTSLRLGTVLDQLARNHGFRLVVRKEINLKREVDVPTLKNVPLRDALRVILSPIGYSFAFEDEDLVIFSSYTQIFRVNIPMLGQQWVTSISNEAGTSLGAQGAQGGGNVAPGAGARGIGGAMRGGGGGGNQQQTTGGLGGVVSLTSYSSSLGFWDELETSLENLLGQGAKVSVNRSAGIVVVNDSPENLEAIGRYIEAINDDMSRQAVVDIRVAEFSATNNLQAGVDWNLLFQRLAGMNAGLSSNFVAQNVDGRTGTSLFSIRGVSGSAVLTALEDQGEVRLVAKPNLLVGNNLPGIIQVGRIQGYIARVAANVDNGATSTEVEQSTLQNGLTMSLLPRIQDSDYITLALSVVLQQVLSIDTRIFSAVTSGAFGGDVPALQLDLPTVNRRGYSGTVTARFGDTLVIGGLINKREEKSSTGFPLLSKLPIVGIFFGQQESREESTELVILVTPNRIDKARPDPVYMERFIEPEDIGTVSTEE